ncbi:unnamed protein product [Caenorhabditis brenneri]
MNFMDKVEDNISSSYVEHKLNPLDDKQTTHHEPSHESHSTGHRLSDAFMNLKDAIIGDSSHKTGGAFNDPDEDDARMMDDKRKMSESKDM